MYIVYLLKVSSNCLNTISEEMQVHDLDDQYYEKNKTNINPIAHDGGVHLL